MQKFTLSETSVDEVGTLLTIPEKLQLTFIIKK